MHIRFRTWGQIVNTKTKRITPISVLRWTLLRHVTQSLEQIPDEDTKRQILWEEMRWLNQYWGHPVPKAHVPVKYWERILRLKSLDARRDFYEYLRDDEARKEKSELRVQKRNEYFRSLRDNPSESPSQNSIFGPIETKYNPGRWLELQALTRAARLGDYFIVDGGFEHAHARHSYFSSLVQRVFRCYKHLNRYHSPAYILITDLAQHFDRPKEHIPHENSPYFHSTSDLYIDLFDRNRLVYLTPDSPNEMTHFDHDAIYILGGFYDDQNKEPLTYQKAVRQNIRHVKLPLEKYLTFHSSSSKALAFHEVYNIMLTLKHTNNDWIKAFRHVPKRKIATRVEEDEDADDDEDQAEEEEKIKAMASG